MIPHAGPHADLWRRYALVAPECCAASAPRDGRRRHRRWVGFPVWYAMEFLLALAPALPGQHSWRYRSFGNALQLEPVSRTPAASRNIRLALSGLAVASRVVIRCRWVQVVCQPWQRFNGCADCPRWGR